MRLLHDLVCDPADLRGEGADEVVALAQEVDVRDDALQGVQVVAGGDGSGFGHL